jgi:uncharacterized protein YecE (DUF72 family)
VGNFYSKGLTATEFLAEYSKHFDTVEVDSTFYGIPYESTVIRWKDQTPSDFLFSLKFPKAITHEKMLRDCEEDVRRFIERISLLQGKLGPLLLQFPYGFKPEHLYMLNAFLPTLPKGYRFVVEVRNKKLLDDKLYSLLRKNDVALAIVDHPFMPNLDAATTDFAYIRWEGDRRKVKGTLGKVEVDRSNDIVTWAEKIKTFLDNSIEVFGYFSKYYSGYPPSDAKQLLQLLNY